MRGDRRLYPSDFLENPVVEDLSSWLARFVAEVHNQDIHRVFIRGHPSLWVAASHAEQMSYCHEDNG